LPLGDGGYFFYYDSSLSYLRLLKSGAVVPTHFGVLGVGTNRKDVRIGALGGNAINTDWVPITFTPVAAWGGKWRFQASTGEFLGVADGSGNYPTMGVSLYPYLVPGSTLMYDTSPVTVWDTSFIT
jgi:hypothetical protein